MATVSKRNWTYKGNARSAWIVQWADLGGKQRMKTFATKKDADSYRNTVETEIRQGTHVADNASITVREGCELWLRECSGRVARGEMTRHTYTFYEVRARLHIVPTIGRQKLSALTAPMIAKWRNDLAEDKAAARGQRTVKATVECLSVMISEMQLMGLIRHNVVKETPLRRMGRTKKQPDIPARDEVRLILSESRGRDRLIYQLAILCGLRMGEIRGLPWRPNVDLDERVIRIRQKADRWGDIGPPKTEAGVRDVPIPEAMILALREWKLQSPPNKAGLVFASKVGAPIDAKTIQGPWITLQKRLGWVTDRKHRYRFHDLRHVYASLLIERGLDVKEMQYLLGHSSAAMTLDTYGHLFNDRPDKAHAAIAEIAADIL